MRASEKVARFLVASLLFPYFIMSLSSKYCSKVLTSR